MYFWSDGYDEYGILGKDPKKPTKDELEADVDDKSDEFIFEPSDKVSIRQDKRRKRRRFFKSKVQRALEYVEWKKRKYGG